MSHEDSYFKGIWYANLLFFKWALPITFGFQGVTCITPIQQYHVWGHWGIRGRTCYNQHQCGWDHLIIELSKPFHGGDWCSYDEFGKCQLSWRITWCLRPWGQHYYGLVIDIVMMNLGRCLISTFYPLSRVIVWCLRPEANNTMDWWLA